MSVKNDAAIWRFYTVLFSRYSLSYIAQVVIIVQIWLPLCNFRLKFHAKQFGTTSGTGFKLFNSLSSINQTNFFCKNFPKYFLLFFWFISTKVVFKYIVNDTLKVIQKWGNRDTVKEIKMYESEKLNPEEKRLGEDVERCMVLWSDLTIDWTKMQICRKTNRVTKRTSLGFN